VDAVGGVWEYAVQLARALEPRGVAFAFACMGPAPRPAQRTAVGELANVALYESAYRLEWMDDAWSEVDAAGAWLLGLESQVRPDVVHLNGYCHGALPWSAPTLVVGHSCVYSWFAAVRQQEPERRWHEYKRRVAAGLQAATLVTAPSATMLAALGAHYGEFRSAGPIYNGRAHADFQPRQKEPLVFTAGRLWDEAKNIASLDRCSQRLAWPVFAAGEQESPSQRSAPLENLRLLGPLAKAEMASWLGRAAIFALPARYEPFGLSALEAALAGCVLVLGDIPSLREIWRDAALFTPPDQPEALLETIGRVAGDARLRYAMSGRARARALKFSAERMARGYLDLYRRLSAGTEVQSSRFKVQRNRTEMG
jgi:glycosyltransferase involved in cell wall biosynthesis